MEYMHKNSIKHKTLYELYFNYTNIFTDLFFMALGVAFLAIMSNLYIPLWPVPVTMQTFGVFCIAFFFGTKKGVLTIFAYILAGIAGLGVFAQHKSGLATLAGPTSGYIVGFLLMALVVGYMIEKGFGRNVKSVLLCMLVGEVILYACGLTGLSIYLKSESLLKVFQLGLFPFLIGDTLKAGAAMALFPVLWKK